MRWLGIELRADSLAEPIDDRSNILAGCMVAASLLTHERYDSNLKTVGRQATNREVANGFNDENFRLEQELVGRA